MTFLLVKAENSSVCLATQAETFAELECMLRTDMAQMDNSTVTDDASNQEPQKLCPVTPVYYICTTQDQPG